MILETIQTNGITWAIGYTSRKVDHQMYFDGYLVKNNDFFKSLGLFDTILLLREAGQQEILTETSDQLHRLRTHPPWDT